MGRDMAYKVIPQPYNLKLPYCLCQSPLDIEWGALYVFSNANNGQVAHCSNSLGRPSIQTMQGRSLKGTRWERKHLLFLRRVLVTWSSLIYFSFPWLRMKKDEVRREVVDMAGCLHVVLSGCLIQHRGCSTCTGEDRKKTIPQSNQALTHLSPLNCHTQPEQWYWEETGFRQLE